MTIGWKDVRQKFNENFKFWTPPPPDGCTDPKEFYFELPPLVGAQMRRHFFFRFWSFLSDGEKFKTPSSWQTRSFLELIFRLDRVMRYFRYFDAYCSGSVGWGFFFEHFASLNECSHRLLILPLLRVCTIYAQKIGSQKCLIITNKSDRMWVAYTELRGSPVTFRQWFKLRYVSSEAAMHATTLVAY